MEKKKSILSRVTGIIMWIIILVLCFLVAHVLYSNITGKAPTILGYTIFNVVTPSMEPTIEAGSYIIIKKIDPSELKKDDIISFYSENDDITNGQPLTHRIYDVKTIDGKRCFITKGDANIIEDSTPVTGDKIIGKFYCTLGFLDGIGKILTNQYFYFFIILIPGGVFLGFKIRAVLKAAKEGRDTDDPNEGSNDSNRKDDNS